MDDISRWVKAVQELERELRELRATLSRTEADAARWKANARYWYAQRDDLRAAIGSAITHLPGRPDTAESILEAILEETSKNT